MSTMVMGTFQNDDRVHDVVDALLDRHVRPDEIGVVVAKPGARHPVRVRFRSGLARGAATGALGGGLLGAGGALLVATGAVVAPGIGLAEAGPLMALLQGALAGSGVGGLVGFLAGLTWWQDDPALEAEDTADGRVWVGVTTTEDARVEALREAFEAVGAAVTVCDAAEAPPMLRRSAS